MKFNPDLTCDPLFRARALFVEEYCLARGWPPDSDKLTLEQIMEIREQDGWRNPKGGAK